VSGFGGLISFCLYAVVAMIWIIPDRRIERLLHDPEKAKKPSAS
jgi:hypothetical protein